MRPEIPVRISGKFYRYLEFPHKTKLFLILRMLSQQLSVPFTHVSKVPELSNGKRLLL